MRDRTARLLPLALIAAAVAGCNDDDPVGPKIHDPPPPLAKAEISVILGTSLVPVDSMRFDLGYEPGGVGDRLGTLLITAADEGSTTVFDAASGPTFAAFAARLTNGVDEPIHHHLTWEGMGGGTYVQESSWLEERLAAGTQPDLADTVVTRVVVQVERLILDSPGTDLNEDGIWTDLDLLVVLSFY